MSDKKKKEHKNVSHKKGQIAIRISDEEVTEQNLPGPSHPINHSRTEESSKRKSHPSENDPPNNDLPGQPGHHHHGPHKKRRKSSAQEERPVHSTKTSKFNKPGVTRRRLNSSNRLYRADRSRSRSTTTTITSRTVSKISSSSQQTKDDDIETVESATGTSLVLKTLVPSNTNASDSDDNAFAKTPIEPSLRFPDPGPLSFVSVIDPPFTGKNKIGALRNKDYDPAEGRAANKNKLVKKVGWTSLNKGKKRNEKRHSKTEDQDHDDEDDLQAGEDDMQMIHRPKPILRRTDARSQLIDEEQVPGPSRLKKHGNKPMHHHKKPLLSETQIRKNRYDGMINKMKGWNDPHLGEKTGKKKKGKKISFGPEKVHPERNFLETIHLERDHNIHNEITIDGLNILSPAGRVLKANLDRLNLAESVAINIEDVDADDEKNDEPKRTSKGNKGVRSSVIRVRESSDKPSGVSFKFTSIGDDEVKDPLARKTIRDSSDMNKWLRIARRTLPSAVGFPVDGTEDVVFTGIPAIEDARRKTLSQRKTYNNIFDVIQAHTALSIMTRKSRLSTQNTISSVPSDSQLVHSMIESRKSVDMSQLIAEPTTITEKIAALKPLAEHLSVKRKYKQEYILEGLTKHSSQKQGRSFKAILGMIGLKIYRTFHDVCNFFELWKKDIYEIHGRYGLSAAAYFRWVRKILIMNLFYFCFILSLIILPEVLTVSHNVAADPTCVIPHDTMCPNNTDHPAIQPRKSFSFQDLLIGAGYFERSYLYYSGYYDTSADPSCPFRNVTISEDTTAISLTSFRLALVCLLIFCMNSIYISIQVTHFYHVARIETRVPGLMKKDHFKAVLCAWDFNCSDDLAAKAQHRSIWYELKELAVGLDNIKSKTVVKAKKGELFTILAGRFGISNAKILLHGVANIGVFFACVFAGTCVYFSYYVRVWYISNVEHCDEARKAPNWMLALPAIFISCTTYLMSKICVKISNYEHWDSIENQNWAVLGRVGMYYLTELCVTYGYWLYHSKVKKEELCYEELFGQELYRIVVFQGIFQLGGTTIVNFVYHCYKKRKDPNYQKPLFDSASLTLSLFFMHTLAGFGFFFCPLISLLIILRLIVTFYHRKYTLLHLSSFPQHLSHNSEIAAPYLVMFFVSYLLTSFLNVFLLAELHPSSVCGPFSHFRDHGITNKTGNENVGHYHDVFKEGLESSAGILTILIKPGIAVVFILLLAGLCHTFRAWASGYVLTMEKMHDLLLLERQDRDFLLQTIYKIIKKQADLDSDDEEDKVEKLEEEEAENWKSMPMTQGIFNFRRGSMAAICHRGSKPREHSIDTDDPQRDRDASDFAPEELAKFNVAIEEALAPASYHHATFRRESVDNWMQDFMKSKRKSRRSAVAIEFDQEEIARRFGFEIKQHRDSDDDDDDYEDLENKDDSANPPRKNTDE